MDEDGGMNENGGRYSDYMSVAMARTNFVVSFMCLSVAAQMQFQKSFLEHL